MEKSIQIFETVIPSPLGKLFAQSTNEALICLDFFDENNEITQNENLILKRTKKQLDEYFQGLRKEFDIPLNPQGTVFQKEVWKTLSTIKYGETISYKQEAQLLENPKAYRAVANANGKNPISIIIPCHRVIASDAKLGGYTGGIWRKEFLLNLEGFQC